ncbi:hypothetical protein N7493_009738 [Penicillium malachiteum]|uniref:N-acetylgalactosaminide beta-1,3-galactosyltransferase n=1 Tax=Penicillium malachiteum TaxID=1324776 RepID=A0AAD6HER9_9EURO|nr:hypothetical protein N7493_009738 [Penicillium malachiteum]
MQTFPARYSRWMPILAGVVLIFLFLHLRRSGFGVYTPQVIIDTKFNSTNIITATNWTSTPTPTNQSEIEIEIEVPTPSCPPLPGIEDVLVILKTGITEAQDKVPVHIRTTLECIPNVLIVSDFEEDITGVRTHDVFRNTSASVRQNPDFALYNRARKSGRAGLTEQDLVKVANSASGMSDNPGWKLDKWKFLPMVVEARNYHSDAKWFVFLEADTFPIWPNMLGWLEHYDSNLKWYLGNQMQIGPSIFAHGGSGFVLSNPAIHAVADEYMNPDRMGYWHAETERHWAGDCILGMALAAIDIPLTWSWPHVTGQSVWEQDAVNDERGKRQWCYPPFTFHHMVPGDIEQMYDFVKEWFASEPGPYMLYSDVFQGFIRPKLADRIENWDNLAPEELKKEGEEPSKWTLYECAEECAKKPRCLQYRVDEAGTCKTSEWALRGKSSPGVMAGTLMWRVDSRIETLGVCPEPKWILPTR